VVSGGGALDQAVAATRLGKMERDRQNTDAAIAHYEEGAAILRTLNEPLRLAHTIRHVGDIQRGQGRLQVALPLYEEALAIYRAQEAADALDVANALRGFALLHEALGNGAMASSLWWEARELYLLVDVEAGVKEADRRIAEWESGHAFNPSGGFVFGFADRFKLRRQARPV